MNIWKNLKPKTRITVIICVSVVSVTLIVCAAVTGNFDALLGLFSKAVVE